MKLSGAIIGDEEFSSDMDRVVRSVERLPETLDESAEKIINRSKEIAKSRGLHKTGAGLEGIIYERENDDRLIGWAPRPNLHLYFHEIGTNKDYPRPHVRPGADQVEEEILNDIEKVVLGD